MTWLGEVPVKNQVGGGRETSTKHTLSLTKPWRAGHSSVLLLMIHDHWWFNTTRCYNTLPIICMIFLRFSDLLGPPRQIYFWNSSSFVVSTNPGSPSIRYPYHLIPHACTIHANLPAPRKDTSPATCFSSLIISS